MWENEPIIVFDTNVFLRIYRLTPEAMEQALNTLRSAFKSIWIPYQVFEEFNKHHEKEHNNSFNKYHEASRSIRSVIEKTKNTIDGDFVKFIELKYPLIDKFKDQIFSLIKEMQIVSEQYEKDIVDDIKKNKETLRKNEVKTLVDELIANGNIGDEFKLEDLIATYEEGEKRYKYLIPPGYKDSDKDKDDPTGRRKYGDLVIWKQILLEAKSKAKDVIYITRDVKEDWWQLGDNQEPEEARKELVKEFKEKTNTDFIMTTFTNFLDYVAKINQIDNHLAFIEMNALKICSNLSTQQDWSLIFENEMELTSYLIHSGDLQPYIDDPISDVEVCSFESFPAIEIVSVDFHENQVFMEGNLEIKVEIKVETSSFGGHFIPYGSGLCEIHGSFSVEFELNMEQLDDLEKLHKDGTVKFEVGGFEINNYTDNVSYEEYEDDEPFHNKEHCVHCEDEVAYFTNQGEGVCESHKDNYDLCSNCGKLFSKGSLTGSKCHKCDD